MIKAINYHGHVFQIDTVYRNRRFKGGSAPRLQPSPMLPTKMAPEISAVKRDMEGRRKLSTGRLQSMLTVPGMASINPNLNIPALKDKLG